MKIAIISDTHDHLDNLRRVLLEVRDTNALIHCGDLVAPFVIKELGDHYKKPIHIVWGNNEGDHPIVEERVKSYPTVEHHGDEARLEFDGKKIAVTHYPGRAEELASLEEYDLVFYGHTHRVETHRVGKTTVVNPGDVMGKDDSKAHYAIYDTETNKVELKALDANPA